MTRVHEDYRDALIDAAIEGAPVVTVIVSGGHMLHGNVDNLGDGFVQLSFRHPGDAVDQVWTIPFDSIVAVQTTRRRS